jgi:hypothetical protein
MEQPIVNGWRLPPLLVDRLEQGRWRHPGDETLQRLIPFLREPVDFLTTVEALRFESSGLLADEPTTDTFFHEARGSKSAEPICLPWLDVEKAVFIAVNRFPGDDLGVALDYRGGEVHPRIVANDWHNGSGGCIWREVASCASRERIVS